MKWEKEEKEEKEGYEEYESGRRTHGYMVKYRAMAVSQPSVYQLT